MMQFIRLLLSVAFLAATAASAQPAATTVVEYVNVITRHYVLIGSPAEMATIDAGGAGPGWRRTGHTFSATAGGALGEPGSVCRFYSPRYNSHFFTGNPAECAALRAAPSDEWIFEEVSFTLRLAFPGPLTCGVRDAPVHRLYNNRHAQRDANHRFVADIEVRRAMVADGWIDEGPAFCTQDAQRIPERSIEALSSAPAARPVCESRVGSCVAVSHLPDMGMHVARHLPIHFLTNPAFPFISDYVLGRSIGDFWAANPSAPAWSVPPAPGVSIANVPSFVQSGAQATGVYVNGTERTSGPYASISPMHELPGAAGSVDERVFPWRVAGDRQLVVRTELSVGTLEKLTPDSHAYAHPLIQFADTASGRSFYVTLQAVGSLAEGDFLGPDVATGRAIVSTSFRAQPLFGQRIAGQATQCAGRGKNEGCLVVPRPFVFGLRRADFETALARARTIDPALSTHAENYFVASFMVHAETYLDARIAVNVHRLALELWYADRYDPSAR